MDATIVGISYRERIERLRAAKLEQTAEKREVVGTMDHDDWGMVLPPEERRALTRLIGSSGAPITDVKLSGIDLESNHPSGGFFGPAICGRNFRTLLELHPVYIDPVSSLAGGYMTNFFSYRSPHWNPDLDTSEFSEDRERYQLMMGIGGAQHFCQDLTIGLESGWGGLLGKIERYEGVNGPDSRGFYEGLRHVIHGARNWITRHAERAAELAGYEADELLAANLRSMAEVNRRIVDAPPRTFLEACQWTLWYQMLARMYNGSGSLGAMDQVLLPFYERDTAAGILTDDEAVFHIACLLLRDTAYVQLGGYDADGRDSTNRLSYLVLEAAELLRIPANLGVAVGPGIDPGLLRRGVEMQFRHRNGIPKFLGVANTARDFAKNGYDIALGYNRIYSGCHWSAIPGREYTMNDIIKINLARVFEVAFDDMYELGHTPSVTLLRTLFEDHLRRAVGTIARGIDFHMRHMHVVFPELVLDLLCHGPIERGRDASDGGLDFYDIGIDPHTADHLPPT